MLITSLIIIYIIAAEEDKENNILTKFIKGCNDPKTTRSHMQKNIETLLYGKFITETNPDSNIFLRACENQTLTFCRQCASMCLIGQYCSTSGTTNCKTNCISNHVNLILSNECCSVYCNKECKLNIQLTRTDRVKRADATQPGATIHPTSFQVDSQPVSWSDGRNLLGGILALFLILVIINMLLRKCKSFSYPRQRWTDTVTTSDISSRPSPSPKRTRPQDFLGLRTRTRIRRTIGNACPVISDPRLSHEEAESIDTDSTELEVKLLADKYVGKWDNSDEEIGESFPKAPLDAVLSSNK